MTTQPQTSRDVIIRSDAWEQAKSFYGTVLGLPMVYLTDGLAGFDTGSFRLYVEQGKPHGPVFEFLVDDVALAKESLIKAGCELIEEDTAVPRCYLRDPFGMVFNLARASGRS